MGGIANAGGRAGSATIAGTSVTQLDLSGAISAPLTIGSTTVVGGTLHLARTSSGGVDLTLTGSIQLAGGVSVSGEFAVVVDAAGHLTALTGSGTGQDITVSSALKLVDVRFSLTSTGLRLTATAQLACRNAGGVLVGTISTAVADTANWSASLTGSVPAAGCEVTQGLVLGADDKPVEGATVVVSTNPSRQTTTDADGSFGFDKLVGRPYTLVARAPTGVGGPVTAKLTATSDPVVLKLRPGGTVKVTTLDKAGKAGADAPISGATVELRGLDAQTAQTGGDGTVEFPVVAPGGYEIVARPWVKSAEVPVATGELLAAVGHALTTQGFHVPQRVIRLVPPAADGGTGTAGAVRHEPGR